jgi:hypothetical protein
MLLAVVLLAASAASFGLWQHLWLMPGLVGFSLWLVIWALDVFLARGPGHWRRFRVLLWVAHGFWITSLTGRPLLGFLLALFPVFLWQLQRKRWKHSLWLAGFFCLGLVFWGHTPILPHASNLAGLLPHLLAAYFCLRIWSWAVAVFGRGESPSLFSLFEFFLSPVFFLAPFHGSHLSWARMQDEEKVPNDLQAVRWLLYGLLLKAIFSAFYLVAQQWIQNFYVGRSGFLRWDLVLLGPALFLFTYIEKARVTFWVAGTMALLGKNVEPDFRSPWLARSLVDYWRRFHYWIWEYYLDHVYYPLFHFLRQRLGRSPPKTLFLLVTFSLVTSLSHYLFYPAPFSVVVTVSVLFGLVTALHALVEHWLRKGWWGIPITWLSVFFLYIIAYPAFGLGWGWGDFMRFWGS